MSNLVYDILESQLKKEIDENIEKFGIKTCNISIDADKQFRMKIVLVENDSSIKIIS